jgi:mannose-6-phosphate isomerase-like protein (cupin superfamily)
MNTPKRVVTGHLANGRSTIIFNDHGAAPKILEKAGGLVLTELWETQETPASNLGESDQARVVQKIEPEHGGSLFRLIEYPPDSIRLQNIDTKAHFESMGVDTTNDPIKAHPGMHKTNTIDYAVIVKGEIYAVLDEREVLLQTGDCLIQRGTHHAWSNRSSESCLIAFVLISAQSV